MNDAFKEALDLMDRKELFAKEAYEWLSSNGLLEKFCSDTGWVISGPKKDIVKEATIREAVRAYLCAKSYDLNTIGFLGRIADLVPDAPALETIARYSDGR